MNGKLLISLFAGLLLAAYSGQSVAGEPKRSIDPERMPDCKEDFRTPEVIFNLDTMEPDTYCVRVRLGTTILLRLISEKTLEGVTVTIDAKDSFDNLWLKGSNDRFEDVILIRVPGRYVPTAKHFRTIHDYVVVVNDQKIDPRVEVEH